MDTLSKTQSARADALNPVEASGFGPLALSSEERDGFAAVVLDVFECFEGESEDMFAREARAAAQDLPTSVRKTVVRFVERDRAPALWLRGLTQVAEWCGATPDKPGEERIITSPAEIAIGLIMAMTGRLVAYRGQQNGRIFNDVLPQPDKAEIPNSSGGSKHDFGLHTEDAYHPFPPDYLGLFGVRNLEGAETFVSHLPHGLAPAHYVEALSKPDFVSRPNKGSVGGEAIAVGRPVLFGDLANPFIKGNWARPPEIADPLQREAYAWLGEVLAAHAQRVVVEAGDILLVNNLRGTHGRRRFKPLENGDRRWLVRALTRSDARRHASPAAEGEHPVLL